jgi:hypothetical protein
VPKVDAFGLTRWAGLVAIRAGDRCGPGILISLNINTAGGVLRRFGTLQNMKIF